MKSLVRWRLRLASVGALAALVFVLPLAGFAATNETIKPSDMGGWGVGPESGGASDGSVTFVSGPAGAPAGTGSARFQLNTAGAGWILGALNIVPGGTKLADVEQLQYSSYRSAGSSAAWQVALQFHADFDVTDGMDVWQGRLVFEPYNTVGNTSAATWYDWDTIASTSKWWGTGTPIVGNAAVAQQCTIGSPCTMTQLLTHYPNAGFRASDNLFLFKAGSNWNGFAGNIDRLIVEVGGNETTYDFEPETACTSDCYVDAATGNDAFGGDSPSSAKKTIQAAVNAVSVGGTVHVAAGTYPENVTVAKDISITGAGISSTILQGACTNTTNGGTGIALTGNRSNVSLDGLTITGYRWGITTGNIGNTVTDITVSDLSASGNCVHGMWFQAGVTTDVSFENVTASNNGLAGSGGRGLWMINGVKSGISITDGEYDSNALVGIDISDGSVTGLAITGNHVGGNGDSGIGFLGAQGPGANLVDDNTVTNNGRYGIEIKNPNGSGAASGSGSVVVSNNTVSRTVAATDARDHGGIVIIRRDPITPINPAQPTGVVIAGNTVTGFERRAVAPTGDGFGILVEGTNHSVHHNVVSDNDIGIQAQAGNPAINAQNTDYFDRGNAADYSGSINRNSIDGNDLGLRQVGVAGDVDATCNWWGAPTGPGPVGPGAGDGVSPAVDYSAWLISSDLNGACAGGSPNGDKNAVLATLQGMLPSGDAKTDKRIQKAITRLTKSLTPTWWIDDETLDEKDGKKVFDEERKVVKELTKKELADNPVAQDMVQLILDVDRALAAKAIADAEATIGAKQKDIDKANEYLLKGDAERANGKFEKAVDEWKKAWEHAQKAMK